MALLDFSPERRSILLDGRRFVIRRLTVGAVVRGLTVYAREIAAMRAMHEHDPGLFHRHGWKAGIVLLPVDARMLEVIRPCVETDAPENEWPVDALAYSIAALSDWPRIVESFEWSDRPGDPSDAEAENRAIVHAAKELGVSPVAILDWPFEAWIAAVEGLGPDKPKPIEPSALAALMGV